MNNFKILLSLPLLALGVFAGRIAAESPTSTANFILEKGYAKAKMFGGSSNIYFLETDPENCKTMKEITELNWSSKKEKVRPVPTGSRVVVFAQTQINTDPGPYYVRENYCAARAAFVPNPGATYRLRQESEIGQPCNLTVIEVATGLPPRDLEVLPAKACKSYY